MNRIEQFAACGLAGMVWLASAAAQSPHEHGAASLNIALDGSEVLIEFISPAVNIVGFEHPPGNAEQKKALEQAATLLHDPAQLFMLTPEAECEIASAELESGLLEADGHADSEHSEFHANYRMSCAQPEKLNAIDLELFVHFPGLEEIDVQFIGPGAQFGGEFTAGQTLLEF